MIGFIANLRFIFSYTNKFLQSFLIYFLSFLLIFQPIASNANSGIVVDSGAPVSQQPKLDNAQNGVPVVNITKPTDTGLSRNSFEQFNVDNRGVIMNNSLQVGTSQLGGALYGNPNFTDGKTAKIILNEVTSSNRSNIAGATEIFGDKADYVLVNPNGITCSGCGFINTPRVTLSTGAADVSGGKLNGFNVVGGDIRFEGLDTNAQNLDSFDIITRAASLASAVHAGSELNVITGTNHVDYETRSVSASANASPAPQIAIDSSALGGMYAGKINLIATEAGVGVNTKGTLGASAGEIKITADGRIEFKDATAKTDIKVTSNNSIKKTGNSYSGGKTELKATQTIDLEDGFTAAKGDVNLQSSFLNLQSPSSILAGVDATDNGTGIVFTENGTGKFITNAALNNAGTIVGTGGVEIITLGNFKNTGLISSSEGIQIRAASINNDNSYLLVGGALKGGIISKKQIALTATNGNISNISGAISGAGLTLNASQIINDSLIQSTENITLNASSLDNSGSYFLGILALGDVFINGDVDNTDGTISAKNLSVHAGTFKNSYGLIQTTENAEINAASLDNSNTLFIDSTGNLVSGIITGGRLNLFITGNIDNTNGATSSLENTVITSSGLFKNTGLVQSSGNLNITANGIDNSDSYAVLNGILVGGLIASGTITLNSSISNLQSSISNKNGGISAGKTFSLSGQNIDNENGYLSARGVTGTSLVIAQNSLNNKSGSIISKANLSISGTSGENGIATNQTSGGVISAKNDLSVIFSGGEFSNKNGDIYSADKLTAQNINNNSGRMQAANKITITQQNGIFDNTNGTVIAFNDGSTVTINASNNILNQGGNIISVQNTDLNLATAYTITGTITTGGHVDITATSITNDAVVTAGDYINLVTTAGDITNNSKLISGTSVNLNASGNINNNGEISGPVITLAANNLTNSGLITSSGLLNATITGQVNNTGRISAESDLTITASSLNNSNSQIASNDDLSITTTNGISNSGGGLLYATNNLNLHSSSLSNIAADIFSMDGNITIDKTPGVKNASVTNTSGHIEAMSGDIRIDTESLVNNRSSYIYVQQPKYNGNNLDVYNSAWLISILDPGYIYNPADYATGQSPADDTYYNVQRVYNTHEVWFFRTKGSNAPAGVIASGRDATINATTLLNDGSQLAAARDMVLTSSSITNNARVIQEWDVYNRIYGVTDWDTSLTHPTFDSSWIVGGCSAQGGGICPGQSALKSTTVNSSILAGRNLTSTAAQINNQNTYYGDSRATAIGATSASNASVLGISSNSSHNTSSTDANINADEITVNNTQLNQTITSASSPADLAVSLINMPTGDNGMFKVNTNPSSNYLIETNLAFIDQSRFLGSDYFLTRMGITPNVKLLCDAFCTTRLINQQIFERTGQRYLQNGITTDYAQMQRLMDNAVTAQGALTLTVGIELSAAQIANLSSDIIWPVERIVNGQKVLVPVLYLSSATLNNATQGATIAAGNNLSLTASNTIKNSGNLKAGNNISLTAGQDITNEGGLIKATNNITLVSVDGNILNVATKSHFDNGSTIVREHLNSQGNIQAGGNVSLTAANDVNIIASTVTAGGNASITAGNDINIGVESIRNRTESTSKNHSSISDKITNIGSSITTGGDLALDAANNVNITGSKLQGVNGSITAQTGDVNIQNAVDSNMSYTASSKKGILSGRSDKVYDYKETALSSTITMNNDLSISAGLGDVNIQGSNLNVKNDLNLGDFTIAKNLDGSFKTNANGTYETVSGDSVKNVNITAADLKNEHWEEHTTSGFSIGSMKYKQTTNKSGAASTTKLASNIDVGGNLNVNATDTITVKGSNVSVGADANINADKVDITSAKQSDSSYKKEKTIELGEVDVGFRDHSFKAGVKGTGTESKYMEENTAQQASNISVGGNLLINSQKDVNVVASNIAVDGNAIIRTGGDLNLTDDHNTQKTNTENSALEVEVGAKVGNAYVEVGYAAKALADATKTLKEAKQKLEKMKSLKEQGRASQKAVDLAYTQVAMATANVASATTALALSAAGAATAASSSWGTGMYAAMYMDTTAHTDYVKTDNSQSVGSTLVTMGNIGINAANNLNMTGSLLASKNGDVNIKAKEANIAAGENTFETISGSKTVTAGVSYGNNAVGLSAGYSQSDNYSLANTHTNSQIVVEKGTLSITTSGDTNIKGGNVTADKVALDIGGNLNLETIQDTYEQQGSNFGISVAGGFGTGGGAGAPKGGLPSSLQNIGISAGATDIYSRTTGQATGIVELSSNNSSLSKAENLTNLLNSSAVHVAGKIDNQTEKEDITFTDADFQGSVTVPTAVFTENGRKEIADAYKNFDTNLITAGKGAVNAVGHAADQVVNNVRAITTPVPDNLKTNDNYTDAYKAAIKAGATPEQATKVVEGLKDAIDSAALGKEMAANDGTIKQSNGNSIYIPNQRNKQAILVDTVVEVDKAIQQFAKDNPDLAYIAIAASKPSISGLVQMGGGILFRTFLGDTTDQLIQKKVADPMLNNARYATPENVDGLSPESAAALLNGAGDSGGYNQQVNSIINLTNIALGTVGNGVIGKTVNSQPKIPATIETFTNPPQGPVIPNDWLSRPGTKPGSVIYYPPGTDPSVKGSTYIRVMPSNSTPVPGLQDGYWISMEKGQAINPSTGKPGSKGQTHIPLPPNTFPPTR